MSQPIQYVIKNNQDRIEDSVLIVSDEVLLTRSQKLNSQTSGALGDAAGAIKLTGAATTTGPSFGTLTPDAAGNGVTGAVDTCFFTFTEPGIYSVTLDNLQFDKAGVWAYGDVGYIGVSTNNGSVVIKSDVSMEAGLTTGISFVSLIPDNTIMFFNFVVTSAGTGTLAQTNTGRLSIIKLGSLYF